MDGDRRFDLWKAPAVMRQDLWTTTPGDARKDCLGENPYAWACSLVSVGNASMVSLNFFSARRNPQPFWRLSQNAALAPKKRASRKAVSPTIARWPFRIPVTRFRGAWSRRASADALMFSSLCCSARCLPRCMADRGIAILPTVFDDLDILGPEASAGPLETDPPPVVAADAGRTLAVALAHFKTFAGQRGKISDSNCCWQSLSLEHSSLFDGEERPKALCAGECRLFALHGS